MNTSTPSTTSTTVDLSQLVRLTGHEETEGHSLMLTEHGVLSIVKALDSGNEAEAEAFYKLPGNALHMSKKEARKLHTWLSKLKAEGLL